MLPFNMGAGGTSGVDTGDIGHSLRFRGAQVISRVIGSGGAPNQCWFSAFIKRGKLGSTQGIFQARADTSNQMWLGFTASDQLEIGDISGGSTRLTKTTSAVYRDPTSPIHVFVRVDTTLANAEDRFQLWVNGVRITSWATNTNTFPQNNGVWWGAPYHHNIGAYGQPGGQTYFFDGTMSRIAFGYISTANTTDVIYYNTEINEWVTKPQSTVKGLVTAASTNSFLLDFNNGASMNTLGTDTASKLQNSVGVANTQAMTLDGSGFGSYGIRLRINGAQILYSGERFRISIRSSSTNGCVLSGIKFGRRASSGNDWDFDGSQVQVTFGGSNTAGVNTNSTLTSDWITYPVAAGTNYIIAGVFTGATHGVKYDTSVPSGHVLYQKVAGSDGLDTAPSGYTNPGYTALFSAVEVEETYWTLNNFSLTAGATYDWMLDVPGNSFATLNPLVNTQGYGLSLGNSNLYAYAGTGSNIYLGAKATPVPSNGKWYWECRVDSKDAAAGDWVQCGVIPSTANWPAGNLRASQWGTACQYFNTGNKEVVGTYSAYGASFGFGDVIGVAVDTIAGTLTFYKNGVSQGTAMTGFAGFFDFSPCVETYRSAGTNNAWTLNFGQQPFAYTPPSGYKALCQRNMPDPAILNPEKHFDVLLHTGGASTVQDVTGTMFQPDLAWIKCRNNAYSNMLFDSIRGATIPLFTDTNTAESVRNGQSFLSNGFRVDRQSGQETNFNTGTFVDWFWKAGGASVTNNAGSITSYVSANVTAGVSIAYWNGNGVSNSATTIGHGLNAVPGMYIVKPRTGTYGWIVYHKDIGNNYALTLNLTNAKIPDGANKWWNATSPTSTVFTVGDSTTTNPSAMMMGYFFAEIPGFSKIFSYTGNGSTDGPFVYCGFKPKFVLIKASSAAEQWGLIDSVRSVDNPSNEYLIANSANAEDTVYLVDILSNGFKPRVGAGYALNGSGTTYIGIAFADVPAKYSLAR